MCQVTSGERVAGSHGQRLTDRGLFFWGPSRRPTVGKPPTVANIIYLSSKPTVPARRRDLSGSSRDTELHAGQQREFSGAAAP